MPERVDELFDEYASAYARGERPAAAEFVARAGAEGDELVRLLDAFLAVAPAPAADETTVALFDAWRAGESPLTRLRVGRGLGLDALADALVRMLGLDAKKTSKVRGYYGALEAGVLEPRGVDRRVWDALADALGARAADLASWRPPPMALGAVPLARPARMPAAMSVEAAVEPPEEDEVDRLFTRGGS